MRNFLPTHAEGTLNEDTKTAKAVHFNDDLYIELLIIE